MGDNGYLPRKVGFETIATHAGCEPEQWTSRAVVPGIFTSTTFKQDGPAQHRGYEYGRSGNPTRTVVEKCLAALEGAKYGLVYSSGLGAVTGIAHLLSSGDHIVSVDDVYGGTNRYFTKVLCNMNITVDYVDARDPEKVKNAMKPSTKMVWIETPTNPLLSIVDIQAVAKIAHEKPGVLLVVDNSFFTCYFQRPMELGADIVVYSLTKFMNGHCDVVMGAALTSNDAVHEKLRFLQNSLGIVPSPFDCYQVNRSLKTLALRMKAHMENGLIVAKYLEQHPMVTKVFFPGLPSHPQHELVKKQCSGVSGMISFNLKGGLQESRTFLSSLKLFTLAESLGGYESLAELPSLMTHASIAPEHRALLGITDSLIRLSVGLESADDLVADLEQAFQAINSK